jgi:DNA-binding transcriptional ArsR family regulator
MAPVAAAAHEPRLARMASLVADTSRARMLCYLLGGEMASAGELARAASVSAATASAHLAKLVDAGLLASEPRGRHRYYRLADADVAHALEALAMVAERGTHARSWASPARARLRFARCCYGHLAGRIGVALLQAMVEQGWLASAGDNGYALTASGAEALDALGLDGVLWQRRTAAGAAGMAYGCLDWSERRDHLAGNLAHALLDHFVERDWLRRQAGDRALRLTPTGRQALGAWLPAQAFVEPA